MLAALGLGCETLLEMDRFVDLSPSIPNDASFRTLWSFKRIGLLAAWSHHTDCTSKVVAVVDSGVDYNHPDLAANIWINTREAAGGSGIDDDGNGLVDDIRGWNFYDNNNDPTDVMFHGTHVAGTIGAVGNNSIGVVGICPKGRIMAVRVMGGDGLGALSDIALGILYSVANGAAVINLSLGGGDSTVVHSAVQSARTAGVLIAAAAGNSTENIDLYPTYPASYPEDNILRVAATNAQDHLASFSNYGLTVDIAAPGVNILSTFPTTVTNAMVQEEKVHAYEQIDGTSMATPHVAGAAALLWSYHPTWTYRQVRQWLLDHADSLDSLAGAVANGRRLKLGGDI